MEGNIENIISQLQNLIDDLKKLEKHSFGDSEECMHALRDFFETYRFNNRARID